MSTLTMAIWSNGYTAKWGQLVHWLGISGWKLPLGQPEGEALSQFHIRTLICFTWLIDWCSVSHCYASSYCFWYVLLGLRLVNFLVRICNFADVLIVTRKWSMLATIISSISWDRCRCSVIPLCTYYWKSECCCRLAYLHEGLEPKVVHRDVKSSNILLDRKWNPKVSDFGLAKLLGPEKSYVTTRVMGTFGFVLFLP